MLPPPPALITLPPGRAPILGVMAGVGAGVGVYVSLHHVCAIDTIGMALYAHAITITAVFWGFVYLFSGLFLGE